MTERRPAKNKAVTVQDAVEAMGVTPADEARWILHRLLRRDAEGRNNSEDDDGHRRPHRGMIIKKKGQITDAYAKYCALKMLLWCVHRNEPPTIELADLFAFLLCHKPTAEEAQGTYLRTKKLTLPFDRNPKYLDAVQYHMDHPGSSARKVAKAVGVDHKTVLAWQKENPWVWRDEPEEE